jgi:hypothetical protein
MNAAVHTKAHKNLVILNELFFTSGPNDENDGVFGKVTVVSTEQRGNTE